MTSGCDAVDRPAGVALEGVALEGVALEGTGTGIAGQWALTIGARADLVDDPVGVSGEWREILPGHAWAKDRR